MQYLQFYQDMSTGTVAALEMNEDGSPKQFIKPELHKGEPCYCYHEVVRVMNYTVKQCYGTKLPDPKEYRRISKQEAKEIDDNTEYSMYQTLAMPGYSLKGEFFHEMGKEGIDWTEIPHPHLKPSLVYHRDIMAIQSTHDFWHPQHAARAFGIETINTVIRMQRKHTARHIVEHDDLFAVAPKDGEGNLLVVLWYGDLQERQICSYCNKGIRIKREN